jgi:calcineurin-like phosphoesterase family protein
MASSEVFGGTVWFTSDTHFSHKNILKYSPERCAAGSFAAGDIEAHDKWLIGEWNRKVSRKDIVYVVGDFSFMKPDDVRELLGKLNGQKILIVGNHDKISPGMKNTGFNEVVQIKEKKFNKRNFPFIEEVNFRVVMCHYPMITWQGKHHGVVNVHGHCHGSIDDSNEKSTDLRVDVGIDGALAGHTLISLQMLYEYFKKKTNGMPFDEYARLQIRLKNLNFLEKILYIIHKIIKCI